MLGILTVLSLSMLATGAYGQTPEIFLAVPEGTEIPPIPFSIPTYTVDSEMVTVDVEALAPGSISLTVFGQTHIIPNGEIEQYDDGESSWVGRDGNGTSAIRNRLAF